MKKFWEYGHKVEVKSTARGKGTGPIAAVEGVIGPTNKGSLESSTRRRQVSPFGVTGRHEVRLKNEV